MGGEHAVDIIEVGSAQVLQKSSIVLLATLRICAVAMPNARDDGDWVVPSAEEDVFAAPSVILYDSKRMDIPRGLCAEEIQLEYFNRIRARKLIIEHCQQTQFNTKSRMPHAKHVKPKTAKEMQDDLAKSEAHIS